MRTITGICVGVFVSLVIPAFLFIENVTPSIQLGIYIRTFEPIRVGSVVAFPFPASLREYTAHWPELDAWAASHNLMKPVVAAEGDIICRDASTAVFSVNGRDLGIARAIGLDDVPLPSWSGCRRLTTQEIAVFADCDACLDSRFIGAVPKSEASVYRLVATRSHLLGWLP